MKLCQHKNVAQILGITCTRKNGLLLLIARAKHGDFKSHYERLKGLTEAKDKYWYPAKALNADFRIYSELSWELVTPY